MKKILLAVLAVCASLAVAASVPAISASNSSVINGCVNKQTQVLRVAAKCTSSEKTLSWNTRGEKGEPGPTGPTGASGSTGATGPRGAKGDSGSGGLGFDIFDASANVIRDIGASAGSMSLTDANQVAVSNVVSVSDWGISVFKNNHFFYYVGTSDGSYGGTPRGFFSAPAIYLNSNCTGAFVIEPYMFNNLGPNRTLSFIRSWDDQTFFDGVYIRGNRSISQAQLFILNTSTSPATCVAASNGDALDYATVTLLPSSSIPPSLASPIRIGFGN